MVQSEIKILMIDDDEEDFMIFNDVINDIVHNKYTIDWKSSYEDGIIAISEKKHDVYFVDYRLGAKTGLDLIKKAIEIGCEAPLIILTGENNFEIDTQAMKAGAADYIVKGSISGQILERSIRYAIANAHHEKELKQLNAALEERVKTRTLIIEETVNKLKQSQEELIEAKNKAELAAKTAEEALKAKTQFLSSMSHEIRTPMNAIIGFTNVLLKTNPTEKQKEFLNTIKMSGDILTALINDILDLAKVEAGKMTFENIPFKLTASISEILQLFETKIKEQNLELIKKYDASIPEVLIGDPVRLHQIILNLVSNAVKFTPKGTITVNARMINETSENAAIEFSVTDTGIGIPENEQKNIFEKFRQAADVTPRLYGGTGLGLSIAKQLVELQGGIISLKSKVNEGSVFSFTLNFKKTEAEVKSEIEPLSAAVSEQVTKNIKVLIAEDVVANQRLMKVVLDGFGFESDIASNGKIVLQKMQKKKYDIILMDLQMPEMNGFETTDYIRNVKKSDIPIVALTADVTTVDINKCKTAGMNDYLSKPIDDKLLFNAIIKHAKKTLPVKGNRSNGKSILHEEDPMAVVKYSNSVYLNELTKGDSKAAAEIIQAYLEEVPELIAAMKQSINAQDWSTLQMSAHKLIPCFAIVGINEEYENMARIIEENASNKEHLEEIQNLFSKIEHACSHACEELRKEFPEAFNR